jgi:hypothetical protein
MTLIRKNQTPLKHGGTEAAEDVGEMQKVYRGFARMNADQKEPKPLKHAGTEGSRGGREEKQDSPQITQIKADQKRLPRLP